MSLLTKWKEPDLYYSKILRQPISLQQKKIRYSMIPLNHDYKWQSAGILVQRRLYAHCFKRIFDKKLFKIRSLDK